MKKKLMAVLLTLCMAMTMFPMSALAAGDADAATVENLPTADNNGQIKLDAGKTYQLQSDVTGVNFLGLWGNDVAETETVLDLNGHKITSTGGGNSAIYLGAGSLKIVNTSTTQAEIIGATFDKGPTGAINLADSAKALTIDENILVRSAENEYCITVGSDCSNTVALKLTQCELSATGNGNAIGVNGNLGAGESTGSVEITLDGATINAGGVGIYQAGAGATSDVNVTGNSNITGGETGIEIRSGSLSLDKSTVTGGTGELTVNPNGNGPTTANAAISVARHTTAKDITVTLGDGVTLTGSAALSVANPQNTTSNVAVNITGGTYDGEVNVEDDTANVSISGGTFANDVSKFVAEGKICAANGDKFVVGALPTAEKGTTVEAAKDESGKTTGVKVENSTAGANVVLPTDVADDGDLSKLAIEVKASTVTEGDFKTIPVNDEIKNALTSDEANATKAVEVIVTKDGTPLKTATDLNNAKITVTIDRLEASATYYVFCIQDDGTVTSYGKITVTGGTSITVPTTHLCKFVAVKEPADNAKKKALETAIATSVEKDASTVTGGTAMGKDTTTEPTPKDLAVTVTPAAAGTIGCIATVNGLKASTTYTMQIARNSESKFIAPAVIFTFTSSDGANQTFKVNEGSVVTVWEGEVTFTNGVPAGTGAMATSAK